MRRIFTFSFIAIALSLASFSSYAQTCSVSTSAPAGYATSASIANTASSSFTWTGSTPVTPGVIKATTTTVTTPVMRYTTTTNSVTVAFDLLSTSNANGGSTTVNSYTISVLYGSGPTTLTCSGGSFTVGNTAATTYYFTISGITLPIANFKVSVTYNLSNGSKDINTSNFQSNANLGTAGAALPVKFQTFDATPSSNSVSLKWMVATEENLSGYAVEKSFDGRNFSKVGFVNAANQSTYAFTDAKSSGTVYYRIKSIDVDGKYAFSTIALVKAGKSLIVLNAFPSPFVSSFSLDHGTATAGSLITISTEDGRAIKTIIPTVGSQRTSVDLSAAKAGLYLVRYKNSNGEVETLKILKQQ